MNVPRVAIIVVNWNGKVDTLACLRTLTQLDDKDICVIVCDNASTDGSILEIVAWGQQLRTGLRRGVRRVARKEVLAVPLDCFLTIVDVGENLGFAGATNIGIRMALAIPSIEFVWLLNNDTEVEPGALRALRRRLAEDLAIGICGSTLIYHHNRSKVQCIGVHYNLALGYGVQIGNGRATEHLPAREVAERSITYVSGASMLVTRRFLEKVGLMEESYFLYFEEIDWSLRGRDQFKMGWAPNSIVFHKEGASIGTDVLGRASDLSIYYQNVNNLRIVARFAPHFLPITIFRLVARAARFLMRRDVRGARIIVRAMLDFCEGRKRVGGTWLSTGRANRRHAR